MILVMSEETLPLAEIKKRLSEMVDRVEHHHDRVVLTRRGRPAAVLMSPDDLESLEETLDLLSTPGALEEIRKAQAEIDSGLGIEADELRATYLLAAGSRPIRRTQPRTTPGEGGPGHRRIHSRTATREPPTRRQTSRPRIGWIHGCKEGRLPDCLPNRRGNISCGGCPHRPSITRLSNTLTACSNTTRFLVRASGSDQGLREGKSNRMRAE
jgi:antitoxin YefM